MTGPEGTDAPVGQASCLSLEPTVGQASCLSPTLPEKPGQARCLSYEGSTLSRKERLRRALLRRPVDRLPLQTNYTGAMGRKLCDHLHLTPQELPDRLDNHLLRLELAHPKRLSADGRVSFDWWGAGWDTQTEGYWHAHAPLAHATDLARFPWPDPDSPDLLSEARRALLVDADRHFAAPNFGLCLFERAWSLRGFDTLLMDLVDAPAWVEELLERTTDIQVRLARRFVALGVDGGYFGDDYGAQRGMLFSPVLWRRWFKPRLARMFAVFRDAGLPVILHSDGDIWAILPDLVGIGLNCLNPVQPEVLEHRRLYREFGRHLSFYGGISTQSVLPSGTPEQIRAATRACVADLAPDGTGLILGPSHRMQSDIPLANLVVMLQEMQRGIPPPASGIHNTRP
jgi:uroporphyrinogen decarboxylase